MNIKMKTTILSSSAMAMFFFLVLSATFPAAFSDAKHSSFPSKEFNVPFEAVLTSNGFGSSVVLPASGSIYPLGYFAVNLSIGNPPKSFDFDFDTGSDLTWLQCNAPCTSCAKPIDQQYKPQKSKLVSCSDPRCAALHWPRQPHCEHPNDQCDYDIKYADHGSSRGVLVFDLFPIHFHNGSFFKVPLTFGCGYDQQNPGPHPAPDTTGVLALGRGKVSILSQLRALGLIKHVISHCISSRNGRGILILGQHDNNFQRSKVSWTPMLQNQNQKHYLVGPAELLFDGKSLGLKGLRLIFDSGASYAYFTSRVYRAIVDLIKKSLDGKPLRPAPEDKALPNCWKGPFRSIAEVKKHFKPLALSFTNPNNVQLQILPEAYLIISGLKNVCLGILDGAAAGLGEINLIGEIFMQDKMVIYDNEKQQIGWFSTECNRRF